MRPLPGHRLRGIQQQVQHGRPNQLAVGSDETSSPSTDDLDAVAAGSRRTMVMASVSDRARARRRSRRGGRGRANTIRSLISSLKRVDPGDDVAHHRQLAVVGCRAATSAPGSRL